MTRISSGGPPAPLCALATSRRRFKVSSATVSARRSRGRGSARADAVGHVGEALEELPACRPVDRATPTARSGRPRRRAGARTPACRSSSSASDGRRRERREHRASRGGGGLPLPDDRLGAVGLEVQQVVVETHPRRAPTAMRRSRRPRRRRWSSDSRASHSSAGTSRRPRLDRSVQVGRPVSVGTPVDGTRRGAFCHRSSSSTAAGNTVTIDTNDEQDRRAGDEAEIADALELRRHQDVEGHGRGEGPEQNARAASRGGALERADERPAEHALFPIPEQEEGAVVACPGRRRPR